MYSAGFCSFLPGLYTNSTSYGMSRRRHLSIRAVVGFRLLTIPSSGLWSVISLNGAPCTYKWKSSTP